MTSGGKLKKLREKAGLTQEQLAEKAGVSIGQISLLEDGKRKMVQESFRKVIIALGMNACNPFPLSLNQTLSPSIHFFLLFSPKHKHPSFPLTIPLFLHSTPSRPVNQEKLFTARKKDLHLYFTHGKVEPQVRNTLIE